MTINNEEKLVFVHTCCKAMEETAKENKKKNKETSKGKWVTTAAYIKLAAINVFKNSEEYNSYEDIERALENELEKLRASNTGIIAQTVYTEYQSLFGNVKVKNIFVAKEEDSSLLETKEPLLLTGESEGEDKKYEEGTWGHLYATLADQQKDNTFKYYNTAVGTFAPVTDFRTDPSFASEKPGAKTEVYFGKETKPALRDEGNNLTLFADPSVNQSMTILTKIIDEDNFNKAILDKTVTVESARSFVKAALLMEADGKKMEIMFADKELEAKVFTDEFKKEIEKLKEDIKVDTKAAGPNVGDEKPDARIEDVKEGKGAEETESAPKASDPTETEGTPLIEKKSIEIDPLSKATGGLTLEELKEAHPFFALDESKINQCITNIERAYDVTLVKNKAKNPDGSKREDLVYEFKPKKGVSQLQALESMKKCNLHFEEDETKGVLIGKDDDIIAINFIGERIVKKEAPSHKENKEGRFSFGLFNKKTRA